jgi:hypothetical protein
MPEGKRAQNFKLYIPVQFNFRRGGDAPPENAEAEGSSGHVSHFWLVLAIQGTNRLVPSEKTSEMSLRLVG